MNVGKVASIIQYAAIHVPYYKNLFSEIGINCFGSLLDDIYGKIPVLSKDKVLEDAGDFLSDEFDPQELKVSRTSGSTGKILEVYWEKGDLVRSHLSLWTERKLLHDIYPTSKCCYFHSIAYRMSDLTSQWEVFSPRILVKDGGLVLSMSKLYFDDDTLGAYYKKIMEFEPEWFMCHPSTMYLMSDFMARTNKKPFGKLRYIELTGEYLTEACREEISQFYQVPVVNHYGAQEFNGIAYECKEGHLHCLENNVHVEIIDGEKNVGFNKKGFVCVTGLNNRCMPLIRYNLGDIAVMRDGADCGCGNKNPYLEICAGRGNEVIETGQDKKIECVVFFYIIEWINTMINNNVVQFQVLRTGDCNFTIKMVLRCSDAETIAKTEKLFTAKAYEHGFEGVHWEFRFVDVIPPRRDIGKLNYYYDVRGKSNFQFNR